MSSVDVKQTSVSAKNRKQTFMRQSRARKDQTVTEEQLTQKEVITPEDVILLPSITKRMYLLKH